MTCLFPCCCSSTVQLDPEKELVGGLTISPATVEKIQRIISQIINYQIDDRVIYHSSIENANIVFRLKEIPEHLIFKLASPHQHYLHSLQRTADRYMNMIRAEQVCIEQHLDLLVIPHAIKLEIEDPEEKKLFVIAEEFLNCNPPNQQQTLYRTRQGLDPAVKQLATFIAYTGLSDVEWRNVPILGDEPGQSRIALVDLEEMGDTSYRKEIGLFGGAYRRGLVNCLYTEKQIDSVIRVAKSCHLPCDNAARAKADRMRDVLRERELIAFYQKQGLLNDPFRPVQADLALLEMPDEETVSDGRHYKLSEVLQTVIQEINRTLSKKPKNATIQATRQLVLSTHPDNDLHLASYTQLPEGPQEKWVPRIIKALVRKGYLYSFDGINDRGFWVQA